MFYQCALDGITLLVVPEIGLPVVVVCATTIISSKYTMENCITPMSLPPSVTKAYIFCTLARDQPYKCHFSKECNPENDQFQGSRLHLLVTSGSFDFTSQNKILQTKTVKLVDN